LGAGRGRLVAEEIYVEGPCCLAADRCQFFAHRVGSEHGAGERTQAAGVGYGHRERASLDARHWRLNDRQLDAEKLLQVHRFDRFRFRIAREATLSARMPLPITSAQAIVFPRTSTL